MAKFNTGLKIRKRKNQGDSSIDRCILWRMKMTKFDVINRFMIDPTWLRSVGCMEKLFRNSIIGGNSISGIWPQLEKVAVGLHSGRCGV